MSVCGAENSSVLIFAVVADVVAVVVAVVVTDISTTLKMLFLCSGACLLACFRAWVRPTELNGRSEMIGLFVSNYRKDMQDLDDSFRWKERERLRVMQGPRIPQDRESDTHWVCVWERERWNKTEREIDGIRQKERERDFIRQKEREREEDCVWDRGREGAWSWFNKKQLKGNKKGRAEM